MAQERCELEDPVLTAAPGDPPHRVACHFAFAPVPAGAADERDNEDLP
jgi:hypothetical protein